MNLDKLTQMLAATRLTGEGRAAEATALLQSLLGGRRAAESKTERPGGPTIDGEVIERPDAPDAASARDAAPPGESRFLTKQLVSPDGARPYKLFVPSGYRGAPAPLIVMLHGCTQSAEDFAAGTRMNLAAEARTCLVAYPEQTSAANPQRCWNWFQAADQQRGRGEPELVAGIARAVMREYAVDPARVFVAGLSAGGAAAAVLGAAYPDLFAAIGVHSGLACGAAHDLSSAFAAMQIGNGQRRPGAGVPAIVFHGERDRTVHPANGDHAVEQAIAGRTVRERVRHGRAPGGHGWVRTDYLDARGHTLAEHWLVQGGGHAWFGGSPDGSYTDPRGPDATAEMLRFFLEHPHD